MRVIGLAILTMMLVAPAAAQETKRTRTAPPGGAIVTDPCRAKANNEALRVRCEGQLKKGKDRGSGYLRAVPVVNTPARR